MLRSGRRTLVLLVLTAAFPSLVFAQRSQSFGSVELRRPSNAPSTWSSSLVRNSVSPVAVSPDRSTANARSTNFLNDGHRLANRTTEQHPASDLANVQENDTLFASESRVPVAPLLGSRLQLNISMLNVHNGNVMLGPTPASQILHAPAQARSSDFYGFGVSIPLGRGARMQTSNNLLHTVGRIVRGD
jgi:hypothetical protein